MTSTKRAGTPNTKNICATFRAAPSADKAEGMLWYPEAMALAHELDPANPNRAAAVLAVLSPLKRWDINMRLARYVYSLHNSFSTPGMPNYTFTPQVLALSLGVFRKNGEKAFRILAGDAIDNNVKGDKVSRFYSNIVGDMNNVTVDRHAIDIACGKVMSDSERAKVIAGKGGYHNVAKAYVRAARILSKEMGVYITPPQVQAVTWVYWRKVKKLK